MTYSPRGFMNGMEGGIQALAMSAFNAAQAEHQIDRSGPLAIARLSGALRAERRRSVTLATELELAHELLAQAQDELSRRPRR